MCCVDFSQMNALNDVAEEVVLLKKILLESAVEQAIQCIGGLSTATL